MNTLQRLSAGVLALGMLFHSGSSFAEQAVELRFSKPVMLDEAPTPQELLMQSDNYKDEVLSFGGREYVFDAYGHAVLRQPEQGWLCSWFGWWCPALEAGEMDLSQAEAQQRVLSQVVSAVHAEMVAETGRIQPLLAFAYPTPLAAGTVVYQHTDRNPPMNVLHDSWFFFLDLEPHLYFDHRAEFVLVDGTTGNITRSRVFSPPVIDGVIRYNAQAERFSSPDRFYPLSLDSLPDASPWPMKYASHVSQPSVQDLQRITPPQAGLHAPMQEHLFSLLPVAQAQGAPAPEGVDPCKDKPRKKVAITVVGEGPRTLHDDGFVDGEDMATSEAAVVNMFGEAGVAHGDIHRFNPENTPTVEKLFEEIRKVTKDLGPCDKLFFYVFAHGTIYDENGDHIPDSPSDEIVYGHGDSKEYIGKTRWHDKSLLKLLEEIQAQDLNFILESCFSGSVRECIAEGAGNPAAGTNWHVFLASGSRRPSYTLPNKGAEYTVAMTACVSKKLSERGIVYPTIEQIEAIMNECQEEIAAQSSKYLSPSMPEHYTHVTYSVSPNQRVTEGNAGVKYVEFTITRDPADDRPVDVSWGTYDPNPDDDVSNYANPKDYEWVKKPQVAHFEPGQSTVTIRIAIHGDTDPEDDETFGVWFYAIGIGRTVTIVDDDKSVASSSSSSSVSSRPVSSAASSSATTGATDTVIVLEGPYVVGPYTDPNDFSRWVEKKLKEKEDTGGTGITITIDPSDWKIEDGYGPKEPEIDIVPKCPTCEELAADAMTQAELCELFEQDLADARALEADLKRQATSAEKDLQTATDALRAFNNPKSYAESNGRRVTSSDVQAEREWAQQQWSKYKNGDMNAQQLSDRWKNGMSDAEREQAKADIRTRLEDAVAAAEQRLNDARDETKDLAAEIEQMQADADVCNAELDRLIAAWLDCEEGSCTETEEPVGLVPGGSVSSYAASSTHSVRTGVASSSSSSSSSSKPTAVPSSSSAQSKSSSSSVPKASSSKSASSSSAAAVSTCPNGTTPHRYECEEYCGHEGGTCVDNRGDGCWSCSVAQCPAGTFTNDCPSSCGNGCELVGQDGETKCYQCKKSCSEVCADFAQVGTNWNSYIQGQLNQYTCVSGASVEVESTTIGSCTCSNQPVVQVDTTVPVCKGTPCGDVQCGGSATCQAGENTVTVRCNWGGWRNIGENQFQPVLGQ